MSVIDRLFLPLRGKINLRTDVPDGIELGINRMKKVLFNLAIIAGLAVGAIMALSSFIMQVNETQVAVTTSIPRGYNYVQDVTAYCSVGAGEATASRTLKLYAKESDYILVINNNEWEPVNKNPLYNSEIDGGWRNAYQYKAGKWFFNM